MNLTASRQTCQRSFLIQILPQISLRTQIEMVLRYTFQARNKAPLLLLLTAVGIWITSSYS